MSKDVEYYERAVQEKATLDEQNRLRQLEAKKLNEKTKILPYHYLAFVKIHRNEVIVKISL